MFNVPHEIRVTAGPLASDPTYGNNGAFGPIPSVEPGWSLVLIASDGGGWEHVSVRAHRKDGSLGNTRVPTWKEMTQVKALCWGDDDVVVQYHPRRSDYVNNHPHVLHLWRPTALALPEPPIDFV